MILQQWFRTIALKWNASPKPRPRRVPAIASEVQRLENRCVLTELLVFSTGGPVADFPDIGDVEGSDIIQYDGSEFVLFFDGSGVDLEGANIDALAVLDDNQLLLSFASTTTIPGLGDVNAEDVVLFEAESLGEETDGTFSLFFSGSTVGLTSPGGNIDALDLLEDGSLVFSVAGDNQMLPAGEEGELIPINDEDLVRFTPDTPGDYSSGTLTWLFDGSDVNLTLSNEDVNAVSLNGSQIHLSTVIGAFIESQGISGSMDDVLTFQASSLGEDTAGSYIGVTFDGSEVAGLRFSLVALDFAEPLQASTNPPTAEDFSLIVTEDTPQQIQLLGDDGDEGIEQPLTYIIVDNPDFGSITEFDPATGLLTYTPRVNFHGTDRIVYMVQDIDENGMVSVSELATVDLTITPVNDPPVVRLGQNQFSGAEDVPLLIEGISVSDVEADSEGSLVQVVLEVESGTLSFAEVHPDVQISGNQTAEVTLVGTTSAINELLLEGVIFEPAVDFSGEVSLSVTIQDGLDPETALSATALVPMEIVSTREQAQSVRNRITEMHDEGEVKKSTSNKLLAKLNGNHDQLKIDQAIRQVNKLVQKGELSETAGQELLEFLEALEQGLTTKGPQNDNETQSVDAFFAEFANE